MEFHGAFSNLSFEVINRSDVEISLYFGRLLSFIVRNTAINKYHNLQDKILIVENVLEESHAFEYVFRRPISYCFTKTSVYIFVLLKVKSYSFM